MNTVPILKSKLIMPELPANFFLTERLKKLHDAMDSSRLVSVCAPAGYGKTTLAVSYLNTRIGHSPRICWYRLDEEDRNLPVFMAHLTETIFPPENARFDESRKALQEYAGAQLHPRQAIAMLCQELWAHQDRYSGEDRTYIVLDDFQNVAQTAEIGEIIKFMLDNLPPACSVFVLNRTDYKVFTEKQKLEQKILEIGVHDLVFNQTETNEFMLHMDQAVPDRKLAGLIQAKTEGWIAGIIILYQAFKRKIPDTVVLQPGKMGHEESLFRYLSMEVLKSIDEDIQDILVRLALLKEFSELEASEIFGVTGVRELIAQGMGFGLFIQQIHGDSVVYRFHSLFREFLLHILKSRYPEKEIADLHLKAAAYFIGQGHYIQAAEHLAQCGNADSAADLVIKAGFNKVLIGETAQLKIWLDLLPEEMVVGNPVLLTYKAQLSPNSRQPEMVEPLKKLLRQFLQQNNPEMYFNVATVLIYIFTCGNDMKGLRDISSGLSWQLDHVSEELRSTLIILDMVRAIGEERFSEAAALSESIRYALLPEESRWMYLNLSCIIYYCLGKLEQAERCMNMALQLDNFRKIEPARGFNLLFLAITKCLKNDRGCLPELIPEVTVIGEKYNYDYLLANGRRLTAFERYLAHDAENAAEELDYAVYHYHLMGNTSMGAACRLLQRLWSVRPGGVGPDLAEARREMALINKARPGLMVRESSLSVLGALAREAGDFLLAERSLLAAVRLARVKKSRQVLCGACFHLARLYYAKQDTEKGSRYLRQAMELAAGGKYTMFWDIHIPTLTEMALRSIRADIGAGFAEELLGKYYDSGTVKYLEEKAKTLEESRIHAFVNNFVSGYKAVRGEQLYIVKAALFGKPEISVNGIKIPESEWKTKKIKGLLEYLLLNSGKTVSKDALCEIFWPDADGKSAMASLRTALHQIRKTLAKYQAGVSGDSALSMKTWAAYRLKTMSFWFLMWPNFCACTRN